MVALNYLASDDFLREILLSKILAFLKRFLFHGGKLVPLFPEGNLMGTILARVGLSLPGLEGILRHSSILNNRSLIILLFITTKNPLGLRRVQI